MFFFSFENFFLVAVRRMYWYQIRFHLHLSIILFIIVYIYIVLRTYDSVIFFIIIITRFLKNIHTSYFFTYYYVPFLDFLKIRTYVFTCYYNNLSYLLTGLYNKYLFVYDQMIITQSLEIYELLMIIAA